MTPLDNIEKKKIGFIQRNALRLISVIFSVCLWFYVMSSDPLEVTRELELRVKPIVGKSVKKISTSKVSVTFKGPRAFLKEDSVTNIMFVDLSKRFKKQNRIKQLKLTKDMLVVPLGVEVLSIKPPRINIELEKSITKKVKIVPKLFGELKADLKLVTSKTRPLEVEVLGPVSVVKKLEFLETTPVNLEELNGKGELKTKLQEIDSRISINSDLNILYNYEIKPLKANLTLKKVPIQFLTTASKFYTKNKYVALDVLAPQGISIKKSDVEVIASIPNNTKGNINVELKVSLPEGVHLLKTYPERIKINVP